MSKSIFSTFFRGFKKGMNNFNQIITTLVNSILLSFVYLIGVGLTSILAKIVRKSFLETKISDKQETYWSELNLKKKSLEEYYQQF